MDQSQQTNQPTPGKAQTQQPAQQTGPNPATPETPYKTGDGSYNRESGKKTLAFVGVIIALITVLAVSSLLMSNRKSSVMIQSQTQQTKTQPSQPPVSPTVAPAQSAEEAELDTIQLDSTDPDMQSIEQDVNQL